MRYFTIFRNPLNDENQAVFLDMPAPADVEEYVEAVRRADQEFEKKGFIRITWWITERELRKTAEDVSNKCPGKDQDELKMAIEKTLRHLTDPGHRGDA